jgi:hypothetical protein
MGTSVGPLPHWSWDDLETALDQLGTTGPGHPVRQHLMRTLKSEALTSSPAEILSCLLGTAILVSQMPSSATELRQEDRSFG